MRGREEEPYLRNASHIHSAKKKLRDARKREENPPVISEEGDDVDDDERDSRAR